MTYSNFLQILNVVVIVPRRSQYFEGHVSDDGGSSGGVSVNILVLHS